MSSPDPRDRIYATPHDAVAPFRFDAAVAQVFPDMIRRSVPGYATMVEMTGVIAGRHATPGSTLYDLGCSLGAVTLAMRLMPPMMTSATRIASTMPVNTLGMAK